MLFRKNLFRKGRWVVVFFVALGLGCGKDLSQVLFHPSVDQRFRESMIASQPAVITLPTPTSFSFAVFGDTHITAGNDNLLSRFKLDVAAKNINFFVVLGDLTDDGSKDEFALVKTDLDAVGIPYYVTIGNHDLLQPAGKGGWESWKSTFGAATYGVTIAGLVRFLFIDTSSGQVGAQQFRWLKSQLATSVPFTFVGSHYSLFDGTFPTMWRLESQDERMAMIDLLNKNGVYAFMGAHAHGFRQGTVGNVLHFVTGCMYHATLDYGSHGYLLFTYSNGNMNWQQVIF
jgi:3',5'-cyclic AMP phosphodiesterase CpdA